MRRYYIGLASTFHDPAIAIVDPDGEVLFAEAAERAAGSKRGINCDPDPPMRMPWLLREYCEPDSEFIVATSWSEPFTTLVKAGSMLGMFRIGALRRIGSEINRTLLRDDEELTYASLILQMQERAGLGTLIGVQEAFGHTRVRVRRFSHHLTHAAHACFTSPFEDGVCVVADGMGEFGSMVSYRYAAGALRPIRRHWGRESLGFLYGLITNLCGYDWRLGEEWKVMGLAPYGTFDRDLHELFARIARTDRGRLHFGSRALIRDTVAALRARSRARDAPPLAAADMAFAGQQIFSEIMLGLLDDLGRRGFSTNLIFGGGCALNCSFNGSITAKTAFKRLYVPCAPGDDGNAIGAALLAFRQDHPGRRPGYRLQTPYLGSRMSTEALRRLERSGTSLRIRNLAAAAPHAAAALIADGKLVGWLQGRAEFGPRALGNRSILADPRRPDSRTRLNAGVKRREEFRPYAPSILHEFGPEYFEDYQESPYMERTLRFHEAAAGRVPAVVHVDRTGRLQTVKREWNEKFHDLLRSFHEISGVPLVLNTSFNVMGRPIVHSVEDALGMFLTTRLDALVIEDYLIEK